MSARPRILIVDDEQFLVQTIEALLRPEGYHLEFAYSGKEALEKASAFIPDIILLDVMMDGMDGYDVCTWMRADENLRDIPIIMLTGLDDQESRVKALEVGADDFIQKPFSSVELLTRIRSILRMNRYRRLIEARQLSEQLIQHSPVGIMIVNIDGVIHLTNPEMIRLLGVKNEDAIVSHKVIEFITPNDRETFTGNLQTIIDQKSSVFEFVTDFVRQNGNIFPAEWKAGPFEYQGEPAVQMIVRDISAHRRLEQEKAELETQLRYTQKTECLGTLAGGITHDFNNILTPILGFTELALEEAAPDSSIQKYLRQVLNSTNRALDLVKQILTFLRRSQQELTPLKTHIIFSEVVKLMKATLPSTIEINANIDPNCGLVMAEPAQIHQILMNLCANAYHAMRERGGVLDIKLTQVKIDAAGAKNGRNLESGDYQCLQVRDTGYGIPPDAMEKIFDPYFTTKSRDEGTGLGLSILYGIVKSYGGDVHVESTPGKGSTFTVYLPVTDIERVEKKTDSSELKTKGKGERILVVDDELPNVLLLEKILHKHDYEIKTETDSSRALELVREEPGRFDLVITDMTMPKLTGTQLAHEIKRLRPDLPIILCTGYSEKISADSIQALGLQGFINKPIITPKLLKLIHKVLDKHNLILIVDADAQIRSWLRHALTLVGYDVIESSHIAEGIERFKSRKVDLIITDVTPPEKENLQWIQSLGDAFPDSKVIAISGVGVKRKAKAQFAAQTGALRIFTKPIRQKELLQAVKEILN